VDDELPGQELFEYDRVPMAQVGREPDRAQTGGGLHSRDGAAYQDNGDCDRGPQVTAAIEPAGGQRSRLEPALDPSSPRASLPRDMLALAAWCGLAAGWLEVATKWLGKVLVGTNRLYLMSRHFVWLVPLTYLLLFSGIGLLLALAAKFFPKPAAWLGTRLLFALALWPAFMLAMPRVYPWSLSILAAGVALQLVARIERSPQNWRRGLKLSLPCLAALVPIAAGALFAGDRLGEWREARRPLPAPDSPNVLLIVLDTVRADHLSAYGYQRATTPALEQLAKRAIRFDEARATAPWTLASHASMFTGELPHKLAAEWQTPLQTRHATLAEYLGSKGYATAGFVANTQYCSYDTRLDRGFTHYEDYVIDLEHLRPFRTALLFDRAWGSASDIGAWISRSRLQPILHWLLTPDRKDAAAINREFLNWLSRRQQARRPFFAFVNYFDAHAPYLPPEGTGFRFGAGPRTLADFYVLVELWQSLDKLRLRPQYLELVRDSYDNCLAYLDTQVGKLLRTLEERGVLDRTLVIVTSDHGEELGEHGLFEHGESLYRPEIRVPLFIVLPARNRRSAIVSETVSLRDLPATIVDLIGLAAGSPFPGSSLAGLWRESSGETPTGPRSAESAVSELSRPNPTNPSHGRSPAFRGPLISLAEGDYVYIRNQGDQREQLFHERDDPDELVNLAKNEAMNDRLARLRGRLDQLTVGPR
jgi:arylsulfatase A-like enzyme